MIEAIKFIKRFILGGLIRLKLRLTFVDFKSGKNFYPRSGFYVARGYRVRVGHNVYIGRITHIAANVTIGNDALIASCVSFVGGDHKIDGTGEALIRESGLGNQLPIDIGDDVWIGHGCIILAGAKMARGSVLAAGAVLVGAVGEYEVWGGVPARFIRKRQL